MDPIITAALIAGGASLFGGHASNQASAEAVEKQIAWERERATHAHQWQVADLKAAGLNPILSAGGSGATTGGISTGDTSGYSTAGQAIANAALTAAQQKIDLQKQKADIKNANKLTAANVERAKAETERIRKTTPEEVRNLEWQRKSRIEKELGETASKGIINTAKQFGEWAGSPTITEKELDEFYRKKYTKPKEKKDKDKQDAKVLPMFKNTNMSYY